MPKFISVLFSKHLFIHAYAKPLVWWLYDDDYMAYSILSFLQNSEFL